MKIILLVLLISLISCGNKEVSPHVTEYVDQVANDIPNDDTQDQDIYDNLGLSPEVIQCKLDAEMLLAVLFRSLDQRTEKEVNQIVNEIRNNLKECLEENYFNQKE